jgi:uncharacterized protein YecE (DUF72 family)
MTWETALDIELRRQPIPRVAARIHIGTQGWIYDAWTGPFYPVNTRPPDYLSVYSRAFDSVEVDSTFYGVPSKTTFQNWAERTPSNFIFSLKLPQEITHEQRLRDASGVGEEFYDHARELGPKLGPILIQLGPDFEPSELPALVDFLGSVPHDLRFAIEFRHRGWMNEGILALLRDRNIALAVVDGRWIPRRVMLSLARRPTSDFAYVRWMGPNRDIVDYSRVQADRTREIELWTSAMRDVIGSVKEIFGYVANTFTGHGPSTARDIQAKMGLTPVDPEKLGDQLSLF